MLRSSLFALLIAVAGLVGCGAPPTADLNDSYSEFEASDEEADRGDQVPRENQIGATDGRVFRYAGTMRTNNAVRGTHRADMATAYELKGETDLAYVHVTSRSGTDPRVHVYTSYGRKWVFLMTVDDAHANGQGTTTAEHLQLQLSGARILLAVEDAQGRAGQFTIAVRSSETSEIGNARVSEVSWLSTYREQESTCAMDADCVQGYHCDHEGEPQSLCWKNGTDRWIENRPQDSEESAGLGETNYNYNTSE